MMNKLVITALFLCFTSTAFSQECLDKLVKLGIQMDSLTKVLKLEKDTSSQRLRLVNDSITKIMSKNKIEVANLNGVIGKLEKDTASLKKQLKDIPNFTPHVFV